MNNVVGWTGLVFLLLSYLLLYHDNMINFYYTNIIGGILLTIHAIVLIDYPFMIVNGLIVIINTVKLIKTFKY